MSLKCEEIGSETAHVRNITVHDDVIKWKHFPLYWSFLRGIHRSPVNSPQKGQWRGALMFSFIFVRTNGWVHNRDSGDLRRHRANHDVCVMERASDTLGSWFNVLHTHTHIYTHICIPYRYHIYAHIHAYHICVCVYMLYRIWRIHNQSVFVASSIVYPTKFRHIWTRDIMLIHKHILKSYI